MHKVLYIDQPLDPPGGGQISLLLLLKNFNNKNYKTKVFIDKNCSFVNMLVKYGISYDIVSLSKLLSKIKEFNPEIIHINSASTRYTFFGAFFGKILKKKVIWHNRVVESSPVREKIISLLVDKIIVISDEVAKKFQYIRHKIVKIYNAIDFKEIKIHYLVDELREKLNIPSDSKIIGIFSRFDKWKGHRILFEAFSKIVKSFNIHLLICGEGKQKKFLMNLANKLKIMDKVVFCGFVENVYDYMNLCDIIVNPSIEPEPFGRTIIEGMALGKVVVATNMGGAKEIIQHMKDGILVEPNDVESLRKFLEILLLDNKLYDEISYNAKNKAKQFDIEKQIIEICKLYEEVLTQ
ncbi:MAG: glycosyltransferase [Endomicrobia bacterium]|nr:glycosyltransferase [Endomicrobiia bacterium]